MIVSIIQKTGYTIKKDNVNRPLDFREVTNDPRVFNYYKFRPVLINAKIQHGRIRFLSLSKDINPLVHAVKKGMVAKDPFKEIKQCLKLYYNHVQPKSVYEWFDLNKNDAPQLNQIPVFAAPDPWKISDIQQKKRSMEISSSKESKRYGAPLSIDHGDKLFGPVTGAKLDVEAKRLYDVYWSIKENGWLRNDSIDGDIEAIIFIDNDDWRWQVSRGLHRSVVLSALEWSEIPIRVTKLVYRCDAAIWPNVLSGMYTKTGALKRFDKIFKGSPPLLFNTWNKLK